VAQVSDEAPPPGGPPAILLVDDEPLILEIAETVLLSAGYEVETARGGRAALETLAVRSFAVVLLDVRMPPPDGWAVLEQIRKRWPDTAVLISGGHAQKEEALVRGAQGFLLKPFDPDRLKVAIAALLP